MDAGLSSSLISPSIQTGVSLAVTKMAMNSQTNVASEMISDFTQSEAAASVSVPVPVGELGHNLDVYA